MGSPSADTGAFFHVTEPPFEVFPTVSRHEVQDAYDWLFTQGNISDIIDPRPFTPAMASAFLNPVIMWLAATHVSGLIARRVGRAPEGFWALSRVAFPPEDEMVSTAQRLSPLLRSYGTDSPGADMISHGVLWEIRSAAENILNDVCSGHRPAALPEDLAPEFAAEALTALVVTLQGITESGTNTMSGTDLPPPSGPPLNDEEPEGSPP